MNVYGLETIQIIQVLNTDIEDKACSYGNYKVYELHEIYLKVDLPQVDPDVSEAAWREIIGSPLKAVV